MARASGDDGCIATVGRIEVQPGAVNVIPGRADLSLDLRAATDAERDVMWDAMRAEIEAAVRRPRAAARGGRAPHRAGRAVRRVAARRPWPTASAAPATTTRSGLWSRAGHDAMAIGRMTDVGMLFVRCHDGISHHPDEDVREYDVAAALDAFEATVLRVAEVVEAG